MQKKSIKRTKRQKILRRSGAAVLSILLIVAMLVGLMPGNVTLAAETETDLNTSTRYTESLGDNASTEFAGRIWNDKSVSDENLTVDGQTVELKDGENFLVTYSSLATGQEIIGQTTSPLDVVFVIDLSGSMINNRMDNGQTRLANATTALNDAVEELVALNEYVRVGVVGYNRTAYTMLPLDHYEKIGSADFFSCSGNTITINARGDEQTFNNTKISTQSGTNLQKGIATGMEMLSTESDTTATINGKEVQRIPSLILLTDGEPSNASNRAEWWNLAPDTAHMGADSPKTIYGFKALMTASYMKDAIDRNYGGSGATGVKVYSIGMGITGVSQQYRAYAYATINPNDTTLKNSSNSMVTPMQSAWATYANGGEPTLGGYKFEHPDTGFDIVPESKGIEGLYYVDDYYDADDAQAVTDVFESIVTSISLMAAEVPTEIRGGNPLTGGYITYTDKIGEYMSVKDVKGIEYAGQLYTAKTKSTSGNVTTYVFEAPINSAIYGPQNLNQVEIKVTVESDGTETITVAIPASVIPVRVNTVELNKDNSVKSHTNNGKTPMQVIYSVGLKEDVLKTVGGVQTVDTTKITAEYLEDNLDTEGNVNFYSNLYTGNNIVNGHTAGDTTVVFEPAHSNAFYYVQEDAAIYKFDGNNYVQLPAGESISVTGEYYILDEYYHGTSVEKTYVLRTGLQLSTSSLVTKDGYWYRAAGSPQLNRILDFEGTKATNTTQTAEDFYAPTFVHAEGNPDPYEGKFVVYLGNNGIYKVPATGSLEITKDVVVPEGLNPDTDAFRFVIDFNGSATLAGSYPYIVYNADNSISSEGHLADGGNVLLKDGQKVVIGQLPHGTTYEVTENPVAGFIAEHDGTPSGTIEAGKTSTEAFTNTYQATPVTVGTEDGLQGEKILTGRAWDTDDTFTFILSSIDLDAPMPAGSVNAGTHLAKEVTVTDEADKAFDFGTITYTVPGVYKYTISEKMPEAADKYLPGMSYSAAIYEVLVTVEDNGDGKLVATTEMTRVNNDAGTEVNETVTDKTAEFTNAYVADAVSWTPVGTKDYTDTTGGKPLHDHDFQFKIQPVGANAADAPMPAVGTLGTGADRYHIAYNVGTDIAYPQLTFTQAMDGQTFTYRFTEVIPTGAVDNGNGTYTYNGMIYDASSYDVTVKVSTDAGSHDVVIEVTYPDSATRVHFENKYQPAPVTLDFLGSKTLNGRDMAANEFEVAWGVRDNDGFTSYAIRKHYIENVTDILENKKVPAGTDGTPVEFSLGSLTFNHVGTYLFHIREVKGTLPGVTYDDVDKYITVEVTDNGLGSLVGTVTYDNRGVSPATNSAAFINTYKAEPTTAIELSGAKHLTGKSLLHGEFYFNVYDEVNNTTTVVTHEEETTHAGGVYHGDIQFLKDVTYTEKGTYTYYISERIPTPGVTGTTYDTSMYKYTVVVEDFPAEAKLKVTSTTLEISEDNGTTWAAASEIIFENSYQPNPLVIPISPMHKVLTGDRSTGVQAGEFEFELSVVSADPADGIKLPTPAIASTDTSGYIHFGNVEFTKAGTYTLSVSEIIPAGAVQNADGIYELNGVKYTAEDIQATYVVTDDRNGTLTARIASSSGKTTFTNEYEAEGSTQLTISKEFTGRPGDDWLPTDKFDFEVVILDPATQAAVDAEEILFPSDANGIVKLTIDQKGKTVTSDPIVFKKAGNYKFIVREVTTNPIDGVNYDTTPRVVNVTVTDLGNGNLDVVYTIEGGLDLTFKNTYNPGTTEISGHDYLTVTKRIEGRDWLDASIDAYEFTLTADNADDCDGLGTSTATAVTNGWVTPETTSLTVTEDNKAHAHFGKITFTKAGTYTFYVAEVAGSVPGITYDTTPQKIVVDVVDNGKGELIAAIRKTSDPLIFTNTYNTTDVTAQLEVTKGLTGRDWDPAYEFEFAIAPDETTGAAVTDGSVVLPTDLTATIKGTDIEKKALFDAITFTKPGVYTFEMTETAGTLTGVSYAANVVLATVTVTDDNAGALAATVTYSNEVPLFTNVYRPAEVAAPIKVLKTLDGRTLKAGEFDFRITAKTAGAPMPEKTVVPNGTTAVVGEVDFGEIKYTAAGDYVYEIQEIRLGAEGITYDDNKVEVTVKVSYDNANGILNVDSVTYKKFDVAGNEVSAVEPESKTFKNSFLGKPGELVGATDLKVTKNFTGRANDRWLAKDTFEFELAPYGTATEDAVTAGKIVLPATILEVTVDNHHNAAFGNIVFKEPGTYQFTVTEKDLAQPGVSYDTAPRIITVIVENTGAPVLSVTLDAANSEALTFDNTYSRSDVQITKSQSVNGAAAVTTELQVEDGDEVTYYLEVVNTGAGEAANVVVRDVVPDGLTLVPKTGDTYTIGKDNETLTWDIGTLAAGATATVSFTVVVPDVTEQDVDNTGYAYWKNMAAVRYNHPGDGPTDPMEEEESNEVVIKEGVPNVEVVKTQTVNGTTGDLLSVKEGDKVTYTITATNSGNETAYDVVINDVVPAGLTVDTIENGGVNNSGTITWSVGNLAPGASTSVSFSVIVPAAVDGEFSEWTNIAKVSHPEEPEVPSNPVTVYDSLHAYLVGQKTMTITQGSDHTMGTFAFTLSAETAGAPMPANTTVNNDANGLVKFGPIEYNKAGEYVYKITEENAGQLIDGVTYDATVYYAKVKVAEIVTTTPDETVVSYSVESITYHKDSVDAAAENAFTFVNVYDDADVDIVKTQALNSTDVKDATTDKLTVSEDDKVTYFMTVTNNGKGKALNVAVTDTVPTGLTVDAIHNGGTETAGTITWNIGELEPGASATVGFTVIVPEVKAEQDTDKDGYVRWENTAAVVYTNPDDPTGKDPIDDEPDEPVVIEEGVPAVTIQKLQSVNGGSPTAANLTVVKDDEVTYHIVVANTGTEAAKGVHIADKIPAGLKLVDGSISNDGKETAGVIDWTVDEIKPGESVTVTFKVTVPVVETDTEWENIATVIFDNDPEDPTEPEPSEPVIIEEGVPKVAVQKTQAVNGGNPTKDKLTVAAGDKLTYYLTVTNTGTGDATSIVVSDKLEEGLKLIEGSISNGGIYKDGTITWNIDRLAGLDANNEPGTITVNFSVEVPRVKEDTVWKNIAEVVYGNDPEDPDNPQPSNPVEAEEEGVVTVDTGDHAKTNLYLFMAIASLMAMGIALVEKRRR